MTKTLAALCVLCLVPTGASFAQSTPPDPGLTARDLPANGGAGLRTPYITSTGSTVPDPGVSQSGGTTPMDRGIAAEDNKIDTSICKGC